MSVPKYRLDAIETIGRKILQEYDPVLLDGPPQAVPIETIIETKFDLTLEYHCLRKNGSILGETIFDEGAAILYDQDEKRYRLIAVKAGTILVEERLCVDRLLGRLRFTCAHELGHWVLHQKLYSGTGDVAAYEGKTSLDESHGLVEWQAKGWQELYLHPMNFSGIIEMDEIPAIQELLKDAKSFCCYGFDCYERYWDITDEEYLAQLETKREEITHEILERCRTKRKNLYITGPVALNVAQKFSVHRLCDKEGKHNLANRFVGELMEQLVQDGLLVTTKTRNGPGVRTATDAEISSPLPGQQQMTL